jgi:uncharacterized membrane protein
MDSPNCAIPLHGPIVKEMNNVKRAFATPVPPEEAQLTLADRAADRIAEFGGSWKFIIAFVIFLNLWVLLNAWVFLNKGFDPYPYLLLSTGLNMLAALQAPVIMMSQNRQAQKDRHRANLDYQLNLRNELILGDIIYRLGDLAKKKSLESVPGEPAKRSRKNRVLIIDDHVMVREGVAEIIDYTEDLCVCGTASTANEGLEALSKLKPDLVLVDITMPGKDGIEFIKEARALHPELRVLVMSMHDESLYADRVLSAGGRGYIRKQEGGDSLIEAMRRVLRGEMAAGSAKQSNGRDEYPDSSDRPHARRAMAATQ